MRNLICPAAGLLLAGLAAQAQPLIWLTNKAQAMNLAASQGKRVLLVAGRDDCVDCSTVRMDLCEMVSPQAIRPLIDSEYVPWYVNLDDSAEWQVYASGLGSFSLPMICSIDPAKPANYLHRTTGKPFALVFYNTLYARASYTNAVIDRVLLAGGQAQLSISRLTYGAVVQIERSAGPPAAGSWTNVAVFTCQSKTTNWIENVAGLPQAFFRVDTVR